MSEMTHVLILVPIVDGGRPSHTGKPPGIIKLSILETRYAPPSYMYISSILNAEASRRA